MSDLEIKAVYTVPELGELMGMHRNRAMRLLRRLKIPVMKGKPGIVLLADIKEHLPAMWRSIEEKAHLRALSGER